MQDLKDAINNFSYLGFYYEELADGVVVIKHNSKLGKFTMWEQDKRLDWFWNDNETFEFSFMPSELEFLSFISLHFNNA